MSVFLETERLRLREFTLDDLDLLVELDSDPRVMHFLTAGVPTPREEVRDTLSHWLRYYEEAPGFGFWAAELRTTGEFIGWFHLRPRGDHGYDEPELGYRLRRAVWGQGLATEGSVALIERAFTYPRVRRVLAETLVVHAASRRVMEKAGMHPARFFHADWPVRLPGDELGDVTYAIERPPPAAEDGED